MAVRPTLSNELPLDGVRRREIEVRVSRRGSRSQTAIRKCSAQFAGEYLGVEWHNYFAVAGNATADVSRARAARSGFTTSSAVAPTATFVTAATTNTVCQPPV